MFIECKTKKIKKESKELLSDTSFLDDDLNKKQILDFNKWHYPMKFVLPIESIFSIILTATEWYAFGNLIIQDLLGENIEEKILEQSEDLENYPEIYPYTICSIEEFESASAIMAKVGINEFMFQKIEGECRSWPMTSYVFKFYKELFQKSKYLSPEEYELIIPEAMRIRLNSDGIEN